MSEPSRPSALLPADVGDRGALGVVVIGGGPSGEHEVSLESARAIADALRGSGHHVSLLIADRKGSFVACDGEPLGLAGAVRALAAADVVVPALHGAWGEDGTMAGFLGVLGVPFVGSGVEAAAIAMDKDATKRILASHRLPVAPGIAIRAADDPRDVLARCREAGIELPCIVKPTHAGSSLGITRVEDAAALPAAIGEALACGADAMVEPIIDGREIDVALLELPNGEVVAGPPLEIHVTSGARFFDYAAKYDDGGVRFDVPARIDTVLAEELQRLARAAFEVLGCAGLARVDFFVTGPEKAPTVVINEVNTFPGMSGHSQLPRIFEAAGCSFAEVCEVLVRTAHARHRTRTAREYLPALSNVAR